MTHFGRLELVSAHCSCLICYSLYVVTVAPPIIHIVSETAAENLPVIPHGRCTSLDACFAEAIRYIHYYCLLNISGMQRITADHGGFDGAAKENE